MPESVECPKCGSPIILELMSTKRTLKLTKEGWLEIDGDDDGDYHL